MTMQIGVGLSREKDPVLAAKEAMRQANANIYNYKVDLALVFSSIDLSCNSLLKTINFILKERVPIIGCSSAALISSQDISKHGLAVMLLTFPPDAHFNVSCVREIKTKTALNAGEELGKKMLDEFKEARRDLSIIFSDGLLEEGSNLIYGLQEKLGKSFPLIGASASDNLAFQKTYLYYNQDLFSDAACGIMLGGKVNFGIGVKHGWKPLGKPRYITKSRANIVYEIDNIPAVKVYEEYFSSDLIELRKKLKYISILYPIGIYLSGEEEYLLRNLLSIGEDGSLVFQGNVPENSLIRLMIGTKESCLAATKAAAEEAKKGLLIRLMDFKKKDTKKFILVFNSVSRYILLRRDAKKELEIIKQVLGNDVPIIGLYTYGEQAPLKATTYHGQAHFHNQSIAILIVEA